MLGSGVSLAPLSYKKVEHRDKILYYKSTSNYSVAPKKRVRLVQNVEIIRLLKASIPQAVDKSSGFL